MVERGALGFKPLAKVNLTPVVPPPQISSTRKAFTIKKKNITIKDVPEGLQSEFSDTYILYAIRHVGAQKPWYLPSITDVEAAWTRVFTSSAQPPLEHLAVGEKMVSFSDMSKVLVALIQFCRLTTTYQRFATR